MSESEYVPSPLRAAQKSSAYLTDGDKPFLKDSEQRTLWREVEIKNKQLHQSLLMQKKRPKEEWHAERTMLSTDHQGLNRKNQNRLISIENERIEKKLNEIYQSKTLTLHGQHPELGSTLNLNEQWPERTSLYSRPVSATNRQSPASTSTSKHRPKSAANTRVVGSTVIPKSLAVGICSGCGIKSFRGADGPSLFPCNGCHKVFYCSATCQSLDHQSHKQLCKYESSASKGSPMSFTRPSEDYWVQNGSMAKARHELHVRARKGSSPLTAAEEVEERARVVKIVQAARMKELGDLMRQQKIEYLADNNMDGPRPCMFSNGKQI